MFEAGKSIQQVLGQLQLHGTKTVTLFPLLSLLCSASLLAC